MKILGIDPGTGKDPLGWYFEDDEYNEQGVMQMPTKNRRSTA